MANKRPQAIKFTTPRTTLVYPKLTAPDYGNEQYPNPDGVYSTNIIMQADSPEAKQLIKQLTPLYEEAIKNAEAQFAALKVETRKKLGGVKPNELFTTLYDQETEEPTGEIRFKFSMRASGVTARGTDKEKTWSRKPDLRDAKGQPLLNPPDIWSGTTARVAFEVRRNQDGSVGYFIPGNGSAGLKLQLTAVQVIDLVSGNGGRSAASHGFSEEEGYEASEEELTEAAKDASTDAKSADNSDFSDEVPF